MAQEHGIIDMHVAESIGIHSAIGDLLSQTSRGISIQKVCVGILADAYVEAINALTGFDAIKARFINESMLRRMRENL